jgi:hypothetical protein
MQAGIRSWWTCKAFTSWIESLTLFDELSNRYQFWELPLVLEMQNFSRCRNCLPEYQFRGQCIASHGWVQLERCGWICSSYTNVVLSDINIVSHAVPHLSAFAECSQQRLKRGPLQLQAVRGRCAGHPLRWRMLQFLRLHHDGGVEHGRAAQASWST